METNRGSGGILSDEMSGKREEIVELLKTAYFMELETIMNYVTNSINPDGIRAQEVKESVEEDIQGRAHPRPAVRGPHQGTLRRGTWLDGIQGVAGHAPAAR